MSVNENGTMSSFSGRAFVPNATAHGATLRPLEETVHELLDIRRDAPSASHSLVRDVSQIAHAPAPQRVLSPRVTFENWQ